MPIVQPEPIQWTQRPIFAAFNGHIDALVVQCRGPFVIGHNLALALMVNPLD